MTLAIRHVEATSSFDQTATSASFTPAAGAKLYVLAHALGFAEPYDPVLSDTEGLSWSELYAPADLEDVGDTSFDAVVRVWEATVGGSPSSMTVTFDPYDGAADTAAIGWCVIEDPLAQTIANSALDAYAAVANTDTTIDSISMTLGGTPSGEQVYVYCRGTNNTSADTADSTPTDFTLSGSDNAGYLQIWVLTSTDNTADPVAYGASNVTGQDRSRCGMFLEFAAAGGGVAGSARGPVAIGATAAGVKVAAGSVVAIIPSGATASASKIGAGAATGHVPTAVTAAASKVGAGSVLASMPGASTAAGAKVAAGSVSAAVPVEADAAGTKTAAGAVNAPAAVTARAPGAKTSVGSVLAPVAAVARATGARIVAGAARAVIAITGRADNTVSTPDPNPITLTMADTGHTETIDGGGHTAAIRDTGHMATLREQR